MAGANMQADPESMRAFFRSPPFKAGRRLSFAEAEVRAEQGGVRTLVMKASAPLALVAAA